VKNSFVVFEIDEPEVDEEWEDDPIRCVSHVSSCSSSSKRANRRAKTAPSSTAYHNSSDTDESHRDDGSKSVKTDGDSPCHQLASSSVAGSETSTPKMSSPVMRTALATSFQDHQQMEVTQVAHGGDQDEIFTSSRGGSAASLEGKLAKRRGYHFNDNKHVKRTTLMMRNLPNDYSRDMLLMLMDAKGFRGRYNFIYLPMDFRRRAGLGYAFVNMMTVQDAKALRESLHGFSAWEVASQKVLEVHFGDLLQGLQPHVERYRNSPVMHSSVPESCRPAIFEHGQKIPPTSHQEGPCAKGSGDSR